MIFYYNASGDILSAVFDEVYQGSNKANTIYFVSPSARSNTVTVAFTLPDGTDTSRHAMALLGDSGLNGVYDGEGNVFNVWTFKVPSAITQNRGTVRAQFYVVTPTETISTAAVDFTVRKGVSGVTPEIGDSYEELVSLLSEYSARMDDAEDDIAEKLDERTAQTAYSAVYGYNQSGQLEFKVAQNGATTSGHIPLYNSDGNLPTGTPASGTDCANKTYVDANFASSIELSINNSTYVMTLNLKNASGTVLSTGTIDLPIESVVVGGSYDSQNKRLILSLQSGNVINVPIGSLISGLLEERTNDGTTTALYAYSGSTQTYKTISSTPTAGAAAEYAAGGVLKVSAPLAGTDAVNKTYADDNYGTVIVTDSVSSSITLTPAKNTEYYYGELSALTLSFSTSGVAAGDTFYITFGSGNTPTVLSVNYSNALAERAIAADEDCTVEICGVYNGEKWLIAWRQL